MKKTLFVITALLLASALPSEAQLKKSSEPRPSTNSETGEMILMPLMLSADMPKILAAEAQVIPIIRNRAQTRAHKLEDSRNGYYKGSGSENWGTYMRLNNYMYLPIATD